MTVVYEDDRLVPLCPHCEEPLTRIRARLLSPSGSFVFTWGKRYAYACSACGKLLGVSHRKGFWAG